MYKLLFPFIIESWIKTRHSTYKVYDVFFYWAVYNSCLQEEVLPLSVALLWTVKHNSQKWWSGFEPTRGLFCVIGAKRERHALDHNLNKLYCCLPKVEKGQGSFFVTSGWTCTSPRNKVNSGPNFLRAVFVFVGFFHVHFWQNVERINMHHCDGLACERTHPYVYE